MKEVVTRIMGTREGVLPSTQAFPPLNYEQVVKDLRLDERGEEAGKRGQPPPDANGPDLVEHEIRDEIERRARKAYEDYLSQRDLYEGRIRQAVISSDRRIRIDAAAQNVLADFDLMTVDDWNQLHILRQEVEGRDAEFRAFRERNCLTRLPNIPSQTNVIFSFIFLAILGVVESIINGMFFAEGSEAGIIGGVLEAMVLSALNLGAAAGYAWFLIPLLFHRNRAVKAGGFMALAVFVAWIAGLNLAIGHYRDLFTSGDGHVRMVQVVDRVSQSPFLLDDAKSAILAFLGIALGVLAIIDVVRIRDLYPRFATVGRERQRAIERYVEQKALCLAHLRTLRDKAVEDMTSVIDMIRDAQYDMQLATEGRSRLHQNYLAFLDHLASVHERLVQRYREANRTARSVPEPSYFREPVGRPALLERSALPKIPELEGDAREGVLNRIESYIKGVNEKFQTTLHQYRTIDELTAAMDLKRASA